MTQPGLEVGTDPVCCIHTGWDQMFHEYPQIQLTSELSIN